MTHLEQRRFLRRRRQIDRQHLRRRPNARLGNGTARNGIAGTMILSSTSAQYEAEIQNGVNLNGGARTIQVDDNPEFQRRFRHALRRDQRLGRRRSLTKTGIGTLYIKGAASNTYTGATTIAGGTVVLAKTGGAIAIAGNI